MTLKVLGTKISSVPICLLQQAEVYLLKGLEGVCRCTGGSCCTLTVRKAENVSFKLQSLLMCGL